MVTCIWKPFITRDCEAIRKVRAASLRCMFQTLQVMLTSLTSCQPALPIRKDSTLLATFSTWAR
jgi:hypothetical protein